MQAIQSSAFEAFFIFLCESGSGNPAYGCARSIQGSRLATLRSKGERSTTRSRITGRLRSGSISHLRFHRFPAGEHFAPVHAHAHTCRTFSSRRTTDRRDRPRVVRNPVERVENAHPFPIGDLEFLQLSQRCPRSYRRTRTAQEFARSQARDCAPQARRSVRSVLAGAPRPMATAVLTTPPRDCPYARSPAGRRAWHRGGARNETRYPF